MRSMWKGTVSFGLVSIPIHLYAATESKSISFRQVHAADGGRVQYKRVCTLDGEEVPYAQIAKGYELDDGSMVLLTEQDLAQVPVSSSKSIDVLEFLPLEAIDPISYDRSYYLEPQKAATKPYVLLRDALAKSGRVALVKVTLKQRESLALLRVYSDVLVLTTLLWPNEVRTPNFEFRDDPPEIRDQELTMARSLIDSMSEEVFDPDAYQDSYQEALRELIEAKIAGKDTTTPGEAADSNAEVIDLVSALQASINASKGGEDPAGDDQDGESSQGHGKTATRAARGSGKSTATATGGTRRSGSTRPDDEQDQSATGGGSGARSRSEGGQAKQSRSKQGRSKQNQSTSGQGTQRTPSRGQRAKQEGQEGQDQAEQGRGGKGTSTASGKSGSRRTKSA